MNKKTAKSAKPATQWKDNPCLCWHVHLGARALARRFDDAFRPYGITHGQFSLLSTLQHSGASTISTLADAVGVDRTTLTAGLKPLERRHLVEVHVDDEDRRTRRLSLTRQGRALLIKLTPVWRKTHLALDEVVSRRAQSDVCRVMKTLDGGD